MPEDIKKLFGITEDVQVSEPLMDDEKEYIDAFGKLPEDDNEYLDLFGRQRSNSKKVNTPFDKKIEPSTWENEKQLPPLRQEYLDQKPTPEESNKFVQSAENMQQRASAFNTALPKVDTSVKEKPIEQSFQEAGDEYRRKEQFETLQNSLIPEIDRQIKSIQTQQPDKTEGGLLPGLFGQIDENLQDYDKSGKIKRLEEAKRIINSLKDYQSNPKNFWEGVKQSDWNDIMTIGFKGLSNSMDVLEISYKAKNGLPLNEDEQIALTAASLEQQFKSENPSGFGYGAGEMLANAIPFMINLWATGGVGAATKEGTVELAKQGMKAYLKSLPKNLIKNAAYQAPRVFGMTSYYQGVTDKLTPDVALNENSKGEFIQGTEHNAVNSLVVPYLTTFMERYSEFGGGVVDDLLSPSLKSIGSKVGLGLLFDTSKKGGFITALNTTRKNLGIQGIAGEQAGETFSGIWNAVVDDEQKFSDIFNWNTQGQIFVNTMVFGGLFKLAETPGHVVNYANITKPYKAAVNNLSVFGEDAQIIIDANTSDDLEERMKANSDLTLLADTPEKKMAMLDYFNRKTQYDILNESLKSKVRSDVAPMINAETGAIHPVTIRNMEDEEGNPTEAFVTKDVDEKLSYVYVPSLEKVIPISALQLDRTNPVEAEIFVDDIHNTQQAQNELLEQEQENAPQYTPGQSITYNDPLTGQSEDYVISDLQPDGTIYADNNNGSVEITPDKYAGIQLPTNQVASEQQATPEDLTAPEEKVQAPTNTRKWTTSKGETFNSVKNEDGSHTFNFISPNVEDATKTAEKLQKNAKNFDVKVVELPNSENEDQPLHGIIAYPKVGAPQNTQEAVEDINVGLSDSTAPAKVTFKFLDGSINQGTIIGEERGKVKIKGDDGLTYMVKPESIINNSSFTEEKEVVPEEKPKVNKSQKEPWQMTRDEFWNQPEAQRIYGQLEGNKEPYLSLHTQAVAKALDEGKPVPENVLSEYNDTLKKLSDKQAAEVEKSKQKAKKESGQENKLVSKERYEELKARLKGKLTNLNSGFDPELFAIGTEMAAFHIESGARKFVDFAKGMISEFGEAIIPYLKSFYLGAKNFPGINIEGMDKASFVEDFEISELNKTEEKPEEIQAKIQEEEAKVNTDPTEAQKDAGNYKMGHVTIQGLGITIENPKGSTRKGVDQDGKAWESVLNNTYGYFKRTEGKDGDQVDTFIGDNPSSKKVFIIDQMNPKTGEFDEHKVMLGFINAKEAKIAYQLNYKPAWNGMGSITEMSIDNFKKWLSSKSETKKPIDDTIKLNELITTKPIDHIPDTGNMVSDRIPEDRKTIEQINLDEIQFIQDKINDPNEPLDQKEYWKIDIEDLKNNPKKYWDIFSFQESDMNDPDVGERYREIKYMQDYYSKTTLTNDDVISGLIPPSLKENTDSKEIGIDNISGLNINPDSYIEKLNDILNPVKDDITPKLEDISYNLAYDAHRGTSFSPEKRAKQAQEGYVEDVNSLIETLTKLATSDEQKKILSEQVQRYKEGYIKHYNALLSAKSRVLSPMITGPSNFPTARNEKANNTEHKRSVEFTDWIGKAESIAIKAIKNAAPQEQKDAEKWNSIKKNIDNDLRTIIGIDNGTEKGYDRRLFVSGLSRFINTMARNGQKEDVQKSLDYIREVQSNLDKPIFADNNSIWKLPETTFDKKVELEKQFNIPEYNGLKIENNTDDERLRLFFDEKPTPEIIYELKHSGWKWSPFNKAWQRQNTENAVREAKRIGDKYFSKPDEDIRFRKSDTYYSNSERALNSIQQEKGTPEQFKAMLLKNGAKQDELDWMDWDSFANGKKSLTKEEIQNWIDENKVEVKEIVKESIVNENYVLNEFTDEAQQKYDQLKEYERRFNKIEFLWNELSMNEYPYEKENSIRESIEEKEKDLKEESGFDAIDDVYEAKQNMETDSDNYQVGKKEEGNTKYSQYTIPGGENYKEVLLTLPAKETKKPIWKQNNKGLWAFFINDKQLSGAFPSESDIESAKSTINPTTELSIQGQFNSSHFDELNIAVHIRINEFTTKDGKRALNLEEVQSDWAQKGKKEGFKTNDGKALVSFREEMKEKYGHSWSYDMNEEENNKEQLLIKGVNGVPDMPFKKTDQWAGLGMKWALRYAAENGFDVVTWTTGETQAERYNLSKHVGRISYKQNDNNTYDIGVYNKENTDTLWENDSASLSEIENTVGKDIANKILNNEGDAQKTGYKNITGDGLKVGGEGMKGFYDQILPAWVNKYTKKWGGKVSDVELSNNTPVHTIEITPSMKDSVIEGQPMFKSGINPNTTQWLNSVKEVQDYVDSINKGDTPVKVCKGINEVIDHYKSLGGTSQDYIDSLKENKDFSGCYLPDVGQIYILSVNAHSKEIADQILLHENVHAIVAKLPTNIKIKFLSNIYNNVKGEIFSVIPSFYDTRSDLLQANEYMAYKAEKNLKDGRINVNDIYSESELSTILDKEVFSSEEIDKIINTFAYKTFNNESRSETNSGNSGRENGDTFHFPSYQKGNRPDGRLLSGRDEHDGSSQKDAGNISGSDTGRGLTPEFKQWFGESKAVDDNGQPIRMYHATNDDFDTFKPNSKGLIFAGPDPKWVQGGFMKTDAEKGTSGSLMPVFVKAENPFDYRNKTQLNDLLNTLGVRDKIKERISNGDPWGIEKQPVIDKIKELGYDSFYVTEQGMTNIAVFDPTQLKSATGNIGTFDINNPNILFKNTPPEPPVDPTDPFDRLGELIPELLDRKPPKMLDGIGDIKREIGQDNMFAWKKLQSLFGLKIKDSSDVYLADNQKNSKGQARWEKYVKDSFRPALEHIAQFVRLGKSRDVKAYVELEAKFKKGEIDEDTYNNEVSKLDRNSIPRYMIAKHAPERNATKRAEEVEAYKQGLMSKLNPDEQVNDPEGFQEKLDEIKLLVEKKTEEVADKVFAGMTDIQAETIIMNFESDIPESVIDSFWNKWGKAADDIQKMWVTYGKFDQETYNTNKDRGWKYYVPLRGWEPTSEDIEWDYNKESGKGSFNGTVQMKGRRSIADDPISNLYQMAQSVIKWGEKNRVKQHALRLTRDNPDRTDLFYQKKTLYISNDDGTWTEVIKEGDNIYEIKGYTEDGNMDLKLLGSALELTGEGREIKSKIRIDHEIRNPKQNADQHELEVMMNGEKFIVVTRDPKLANEIKKAELIDIPKWMSWKWFNVSKITRGISALRTAKNPAWIIKNLTRDLQGAIMNTWIENDTKTTVLYVKNVADIMAFMVKGKKGKAKSDLFKYQEEFIAGGGRTGTTNLEDIDTIKGNLDKDIKKINQEVYAKAHPYLAVGKLIIRADKGAMKILEHIDTLAQYTENLTRFAAYVTAREQGKTVVQAINIAKEISVNFDRKGNASSAIGSLIGFFNAAVQGGARYGHSFKHHTLRFGIAELSLATLGYVMSMINGLLWDDDDKEKDYKEHNKHNRYNNIIIAPGNKFTMIPLAQGHRFFYAVGNIVYDLQHEKTDAATATYDLIDQFQNAMSPIDVTSFWNKDDKGFNLASIAKIPTLLEPIISVWVDNKDYKNDLIHREPSKFEDKEYIPDSQLHKRNVNPLYKALTDNLFILGGGDPKVRSIMDLKDGKKVWDIMDINPSDLEYITKDLGAGPASFVLDAITTMSKMIETKAEKAKKEAEIDDITEGFDFTTVPIINSFYRNKYKGRVDDEYRKLSNWYKDHNNSYKAQKDAGNYHEVLDAMLKNDLTKFNKVKVAESILSKLYKIKNTIIIDESMPYEERKKKQLAKDNIEHIINNTKRNIVSKYSKP